MFEKHTESRSPQVRYSGLMLENKVLRAVLRNLMSNRLPVSKKLALLEEEHTHLQQEMTTLNSEIDERNRLEEGSKKRPFSVQEQDNSMKGLSTRNGIALLSRLEGLQCEQDTLQVTKEYLSAKLAYRSRYK